MTRCDEQGDPAIFVPDCAPWNIERHSRLSEDEQPSPAQFPIAGQLTCPVPILVCLDPRALLAYGTGLGDVLKSPTTQRGFHTVFGISVPRIPDDQVPC
jgi:hypothetical protein